MIFSKVIVNIRTLLCMCIEFGGFYVLSRLYLQLYQHNVQAFCFVYSRTLPRIRILPDFFVLIWNNF